MIRRAWPLLALVLAAALPPAGAPAHGVEGPMVMAAGAPVEDLRLPDIPVSDATGASAGIVTRYGGAGRLLIAFSYTGCVTLCPITHAILAAVDEALEKPGAPALTILTISIDPLNDTPARLAETAAGLGASPCWHWLVARPEDTPALLAAFGVPPGPVEAHDPLFLLGDMRDGRFRRIQGVPDPADLLALAAE